MGFQFLRGITHLTKLGFVVISWPVFDLKPLVLLVSTKPMNVKLTLIAELLIFNHPGFGEVTKF